MKKTIKLITQLASLIIVTVLLYSDVSAQNDSILASPLEELLDNDSNLNTPSDNLEVNLKDSTNQLTGGENDKVLTGFNNANIDLKQGEIVSNVMKVYNNSNESIKFTLDVLAPGSWKQLHDIDKIYEATPNDTVFIPIILIPNKLINGNTEVIINTFLIDEDDNQIGNNYFTLKTKRKTSWNVSVEPSNRLYFKNDENTIDFKYRIENNLSPHTMTILRIEKKH